MTTPLTTAAPSLRAALEAKGVRYALASFVDLHGVSKAKAVPLAHLGQMFAGSELFTGAALDGVPQEVSDNEVAAVPDPSTCTVLPWQPEVAWFASDLHLQGEPFTACSRNILQRVRAEAASMGYRFNLGIETEFFVLKRDADGRAVPFSDRDTLEKPAYDVRGLLDNLPWLDELVGAMNQLGWGVYSFDHEDGPGQFETDFDYADALTMADRLTFFKLMAKEIAHRHGLIASFMPKPFGDRTGSGAHYNMSLADVTTGQNLFLSESGAPGTVSRLADHFIAGILRHAAAICAVIAPTVNSYKRLVAQGSMSGFTWAPVFICYGNNNRTNMLRIPSPGGRVECRAADISCNPYLGAAMILAAGLEGIREQFDPGEPNLVNAYSLTADQLAERGIGMLPRTLAQAIEAFAMDPLSKKVFGDAMFDAYVTYKRQEWESYHCAVSDWEQKRYLEFF
ncbi:type III glutamate--ammonia ligase [Synechococcus sp. HJ21-Hayes]|jgi:glutamine synthetase|uniref:type III glutamate--ammonia ligase n=1 Tax=unclassified Synechococcus TaxID=2626047 RepID=UPI0020CD2A12|nr:MULTISPECIES: type III glutamate--ammonia ligase [unclassified Synechococcus]MCP9830840.1 type III glutamate--ammonia ligase [Synechococcus sp. JJ3a-Johnson]MCP9853137.1 type III glutamate--ammonia ligase [Synechococcus sp. HJ21-Hayes]